jgi:predicted ATP-grasp superfamily ATP-dependent carboligase
VLLADGSFGQNRSALAAVRALGMAGYRVTVTRSGPLSLAAASRFCSGVLPTAPAGMPAFASEIRKELSSRDYLTVIPASDAAIMALSLSGIDYIDKTALFDLARAAGLVVPPGTRYRSIQELSGASLDYPCVVKTSVKTAFGAMPARLLRGSEDLDALRDAAGPFIVQPFVPDAMHSICGVMWRRELLVRVHQRHLRLWPPVCGDTCAAVTIEPDRALCARLAQLMGDYEGVIQAEFAGDHLLDVNPRVYASLPLATFAGVNLVAFYCDLLQGKAPAPAQVSTGVRYRWWEGELRNLALHVRTRQRLGGPRLPARERPSSPTGFDPKPALVRLSHVARSAVARDEA